MRKLRKSFPLKKNRPKVKVVKDDEKNETSEAPDKEHSEKDDSDDEFDAKEALRRNKQRQKKQIILPTINLDEYVYTAIILILHIFLKINKYLCLVIQ